MSSYMSRRRFAANVGTSWLAAGLLPPYINLFPGAAKATTGGKPYGSGYFGEWITDAFGLPAYRYTCEQHSDPKAISPTDTIFRAPTDHFHQIGNGRVVALVSNYGYVQLRQDEGGAKFLNDYNPQEGHYGGGIGYLSDGSTVLSTYYPGDASQFERIFGMGYLRKQVRGGGLSADQVVFAPFGGDPVLVSEVTIRNETSRPADLTWTEFWGCQTYEFSNFAGGLTHTEQHLERRRIGSQFRHTYEMLPGQLGLVERKHFAGMPPAFRTGPGGAHGMDLAPPATFLASLGEAATALGTDAKAFLGSGGIREPDGVRAPWEHDLHEQGTQAALILQQRLTLAPGESRTLHYLYGYLVDDVDAGALVSRIRANGLSDLLSRSAARWKADGVRFESNGEAWAQREVTWSHYYLRSGMTYDSFFGEHVLSQGHAYQYIEGGSVGGRDMLQHILPFIYTQPRLVRETLRYYCKILRADGSIAGSSAYGMVAPSGTPEDGPSDVDLWLLWTAAEYVLATRDLAFLDEEVALFPIHAPDARQATVRECLHRAWKFQTDVVGRGPHGLMRTLSGDWNDNLQLDSCPGELSHECRGVGESVMNSAMAAYIFEHYANMCEYAGAPVSELVAIRAAALSHREAVRAQWAGRWFRRAWFGPTRGWAGDQNNFWLEPQPWAIIGGSATEEQRRVLTASIDELVRRPSPIGAMLGNQGQTEFGAVGERIGQAEDGGVWPAINQTLIWALTKTDPAMAWDEWKKNTLAMHAEAYPTIWYGIWSGPDTYNSVLNKNPGQTMISDLILQPKGVGPGAFSYATDFGMVDFPVMNMHPHSAILIGLTKLIGPEFTPEGIVLTPTLPLATWRFATPLFGLARSDSGYEGWYAPSGPLKRWKVRLRLPQAELERVERLHVNGKAFRHPHAHDGEIVIEGEGGAGKPLEWRVNFGAG